MVQLGLAASASPVRCLLLGSVLDMKSGSATPLPSISPSSLGSRLRSHSHASFDSGHNGSNMKGQINRNVIGACPGKALHLVRTYHASVWSTICTSQRASLQPMRYQPACCRHKLFACGSKLCCLMPQCNYQHELDAHRTMQELCSCRAVLQPNSMASTVEDACSM